MASSTSITTTSVYLSSPDFLSALNPRPNSPLALTRLTKLKNNQSHSLFATRKLAPIWRTKVAVESPPPEEVSQLLDSASPEEIVSAVAGEDGSSKVISALLFVAFVGLSLLTIGVIYIAVADFLQKREREKFEKEEEANAKKNKGKKKKKPKARAGPRGFGQKIDDEIDD